MEGCGYRDLKPEFDKLGVRIVGVSFSDLDVMARWKAEEQFGYEIWQDVDRTLSLWYDAVDDPQQAYPNRRTRVLDANGVLMLEYSGKVVAGTHPSEVLSDLQKLLGTN